MALTLTLLTKVALASRVASLEALKAQLEQQLRLEREVGDKELATRQQVPRPTRRLATVGWQPVGWLPVGLQPVGPQP